MGLRHLLGVGACLLLALAPLDSGQAQQAPAAPPPPLSPPRDVRGEDVLQRFERDDAPTGIAMGGFTLRPQLQAGVTYDDNVFATDRNKRGDWIGNVGAGARLDSNFTRHAVGVSGNIDVNKFADNSDEDYWHGDLGARGRLDMTRETQFGADTSVRRLTEPRDSPDDAGGREPVVFRVYHAAASALHAGPVLLGRMEAGIDRYEYDDVATATGTIGTRERERDEFYVDGRVGYQYLGPQQIYLQTRLNTRNYDQALDNGGFRRDSDGHRTEVGATFDLGGLIFGDVSAGYQEQKYDDPRFGSPGRPVAAANLLWNPTRRTSVRGEARYEFTESFNTGSPGYWRTLYLLTLSQEVRHDVVALARLVWQEREFSNLTREDEVYGGDVGLRYRVDRGLFIEGEYRYREQESSVTTADYTRNLALIRLRRIF